MAAFKSSNKVTGRVGLVRDNWPEIRGGPPIEFVGDNPGSRRVETRRRFTAAGISMAEVFEGGEWVIGAT
jgi:hypothetical protein